MAEVQIAVQRYFAISTDEWTEGPLQLASRAIAPGSRTTYISALRQFIRHSKRPNPLKKPSMTECVLWPVGKEENRQRPAWFLGSEPWRNSNCCPRPYSTSTGSKLKQSPNL